MRQARLLRDLFKRSPLYRSPFYFRVSGWYQRYLERGALKQWEAHGRRSAPPHSIKRTAVRTLARELGLRTLVETGTALGEMVFAMRNEFTRIYSIELEPTMFENAKHRLRHQPHVTLLHGDSAKVLPQLVAELGGPALFWLDGHYSGERTGHGILETPVREELMTILRAGRDRHVVLIDDAHCFTGAGDYPTLDEVTALVKCLRPDAQVSVTDNIIRIL